jgi:dienelactone hydrolase
MHFGAAARIEEGIEGGYLEHWDDQGVFSAIMRCDGVGCRQAVAVLGDYEALAHDVGYVIGHGIDGRFGQRFTFRSIHPAPNLIAIAAHTPDPIKNAVAKSFPLFWSDLQACAGARVLAEHGYATLHLAYFLAPGLPTALHLIPLEYFKTAVDWLRAQPGVDPERIGIVGTSIGGMAALVLAAHYPELKIVIAAVPSSVIWSTFGSSRVSMFALAGQPLPFLPYGYRGGSRIYNLYDDGLNGLAEHPDAIIPVEQINGPVMLICGKVDSLWPSCRMSAQVIARLEANKCPHAFQLLEYPKAGHSVLGPPVAPDSPAFASLGSLGGSPASNNAARIDSWPKAVAFIDAALKPRLSPQP